MPYHKIIFLVFSFAHAQTVFAQMTPLAKAVAHLAPGWKIENSVEGDLNSDKTTDIAVIISKDNPVAAELRIYTANSKSNLELVVSSSKAICIDCGGASGFKVPFELDISKGVLTVAYMGGGGSFRSESNFKWRKEKDIFKLIGLEQSSGDAIPAAGSESYKLSANFLNGKIKTEVVKTITVTDDGEPLKQTTAKSNCKVPDRLKLVNLAEFDINQFFDKDSAALKCNTKR